MRHKFLALSFVLVSVLAGCGGSNGSSSSAPPPGGIYLGYYQEDPSNNPEDPTAGAYVVNLPVANQPFTGNMYFTYVGCQTSNVGSVTGNKAGNALSGTWAGVLDGVANAGTFAANYSQNTSSYQGSFTNNVPKQHINRLPCIEYYIAALGSFEAFPVEHSVPSDFKISIVGRQVTSPAVADGSFALHYIIDPAIVTTSGNPVVMQSYGPFATTFSIPSGVALTPGKEYIMAVAVAGPRYQKLAFTSKRFIAS